MQRTPGIYTSINIQTQRTGLPAQNHSIVFVTGDATAPAVPKPIYDTASADALCGNDSKAGRMIAAALTVSQGVSVDVLGKNKPMVCTPSHTKITGAWNIGGGFDFTYLTYSRNGGELQTVNLVDMTAEQQSLLVMQSLYLSSDNTNFAFIDSSIMPELSVFEDNGKVTLAASGIDADGNVIFFGEAYSLIGMMIRVGSVDDYIVEDILPEQNTIEIHRTPNTLAANDAYTYFKTEQTNDEPVIMTSCAKAVIKRILL